MFVDFQVMYNNAMYVIKQQKKEIEKLNGIIQGASEFKVCSMCKKIKHESQFHRSGKGRRHCYCKICRSQYQMEYKNKKTI